MGRHVSSFYLVFSLCERFCRSQSGSTSSVVVENVEIKSTAIGTEHHVTVTITGESKVNIDSSCVIKGKARSGIFVQNLQEERLGSDIKKGPFTYVHTSVFEAPSGIHVDVSIKLMQEHKQLLSIKDMTLLL